MDMDEFTKIIVGVIFISLGVFLAINYKILFFALNMLFLYIGPILIFLCIMSALISIFSLKGDRSFAVIGVFLPAIFIILMLAFYLPPAFNIFHIYLFTWIEGIPFDFGVMGFVLTLIKGFLLSHIIARKEIDIIERLLLSIGLGFGIVSFAMILLGTLWKISGLTIILMEVALFTVLIIALFIKKPNFTRYLKFLKERSCYMPRLNFIEITLLMIIALYFLIAIYQTVAYPVIEWDSLAYGANYAKLIFENKKVPLIAGPSIGLEISANYPPGVQLFAVYIYVLAGTVNDFYYRILQPIFGLAVALTTYKLTRNITKSKTASLFAIFILIIFPVFWEFFIRESYLMCLTSMLTLSAYFFFKAYNTYDYSARKYEVIATLFCGFSALTSYTGVFSLGMLLLYTISRKLSVKRLISLISLVLLIALPWFIRNFLLLGNPIYPFFGIGKYLDPLLKISTTQHFQNWLREPMFEITSVICKIEVIVLFLIVVYLTFIKRKNFIVTLTIYLLFVSILLMAFHIPFTRYLVISLPLISAVLSATIESSLAKHDDTEKIITLILISLILFSGVRVISYLNYIKPMYFAKDKWDYLSQIYEDADVWKWINENTPPDAGIATYDIREYYIEREVMLLDGYDASPLYRMNSIEEGIKYLIKRNIKYIVSVTWASPMDTRMPPAYKWCILTKYFGDPRYLPPVYVSPSGATVYHVGPLNEKILYESFAQKDLVPPLNHLQVNVTITNQTYPFGGKFYIPIPVDYREGLMVVLTNSQDHLVQIKLLSGILKETTRDWNKTFETVKKWPQSDNGSGIRNPSFVWEVNRAGYLTFLVTLQDSFMESFNVTVDIKFYNYWNKDSLFIHEGFNVYNITFSDNVSPQMKTLYIQANEPSVLNVKSILYNGEIALQIFKGFLPNVVMNWSEQYEPLKQQLSSNEAVGMSPSISNMVLSYGRYSLLIICRGNYKKQTNLLLEIDLSPLRERACEGLGE